MKTKRLSDVYPYVIHVLDGSIDLVQNEIHRLKKSISYRYLCIVSGECELFISGMAYNLKKGDLCYFCPGDVYMTTPKTNVNVINVYFAFNSEDKKLARPFPYIDTADISTRYEFSDYPILNTSFVLTEYPTAGIRIAEILNEEQNKMVLSDRRQNQILDCITTDIIRYTQSSSISDNNSILLNEITNYINAHITEKLRCSNIAEHFNYHPNYLNRLINQHRGSSLHRYILELKIKSATEELIQTDVSIALIAQNYCFNDSSHFARCYNKVTGFIPSDVRKAARMQ